MHARSSVHFAAFRRWSRVVLVSTPTLALLLIAWLALATQATLAQPSDAPLAATLTVNNTNDSGAGSLRQTIRDANAGDTIQFAASLNGQTIVLTSGALWITKSLTIDGSTLPAKLTISGNNASRIFKVSGNVPLTLNSLILTKGYNSSEGGAIFSEGTLTLLNVSLLKNKSDGVGGGLFVKSGSALITGTTLISGNVSSGTNPTDGGGGVFIDTGKLNIYGAQFQNNSASVKGGALYVHEGSYATVDRTQFLNNSAYDGGAIKSHSMLTVTNSLIRYNIATNDGGGFYQYPGGIIRVINSTVSDNTAGAEGGGIYNSAGVGYNSHLVVLNSTLSGNNSAIYNQARIGTSAWTTITHSTIVSNQVGIENENNGNLAKLTIQNTIVAQNVENCDNYPGATLVSLGYNLESLNQCGFNAVGDKINTDPKVGPLQNNGGPIAGAGQVVPTHALLSGSPAINAIPTAQCAASTDQRGISRPQGGACDIGAFEVVAPSDTTAPTWPPTSTLTSLYLDVNTLRLTWTPAQDNVGVTAYRVYSGASLLATVSGVSTTYIVQNLRPNKLYPFKLEACDAANNCTTNGPAHTPPVLYDLYNHAWTQAYKLRYTTSAQVNSQEVLVSEHILKLGQSAWFKAPIKPGSKIVVSLSNLPANYDLALYKDIGAALYAIQSQQDLLKLSAEFAPEAFTPEAFTPEAFTPEAFTPEAFTPEAFTPEAFTPEAFTPEAFTPEAFTPEAFTPEAFTPEAFTPEAFTPEAFTPEAFTPEAFTPDNFSAGAFAPEAFTPVPVTPEAYANAQLRSLLAVSAQPGTASELIVRNTWDNTGSFYIRVRGRDGTFNLTQPFRLRVTLIANECANVAPITVAPSLNATAGNYRTLILTNLARMAGSATEKATLQARLAAFAARPEVRGIVVDVSADAKVAAAFAQADANVACPFAQNVVASAIKEIVERYRAQNPLEYVTLIGGDTAIPFFRHPDQSGIGNESNYVPPVRDNTISQASLRLNYVLSQDRYGSRTDISRNDHTFPLADLAVGRLVETAADATGMLDAYLRTTNGVLSINTPALVTGYDFLEDVANAVRAELAAGTARTVDTLITAHDIAPSDPRSWTADQLRASFLNNRHDINFLAGHFSAVGALAADYRTRMTTQDVLASAVDLENALIFSAGCHSAYNLVDSEGIPGVTVGLDWAQMFARKRATLVAGTGYQYGDTDLIEYGERLYLEFSKQLRTGSGAVPIGKALVNAKRTYLANLGTMRGIHEKTLLESTLFGLPMLSINMPGARLTPPTSGSIVTGLTNIPTGPGQTLGLRYADVVVAPTLTPNTVVLKNIFTNATLNALYYSGKDGTLANPAEPIMPLNLYNVNVAGQILRGVGFRGGSYSDAANVLPLISAADTEIRGVHAPFLSEAFYPIRPWNINYFDTIANGGVTRLSVPAVQFKSSAPDAQTGTLRRFNNMNFRLFYNTTTGDPALASSPSISRVVTTVSSGVVNFKVYVLGDPRADIQTVWVNYTAVSGPLFGNWQPLDLTRNATNTTLWEGSLPLGATAVNDFRFMVQAVNGVGLATLDTNVGRYYSLVTPTPGSQQATALVLQSPPTSAPYGERRTFSARLTSNGSPLANQRVTFTLGSQRRSATTDANGVASASLLMFDLPGSYRVRATFAATEIYLDASAEASFTITKQGTKLTFEPVGTTNYTQLPIVVTLRDINGKSSLSEQTVIFVVTCNNSAVCGSSSFSIAEITDFAGRATLSGIPLPTGSYTIKAYFLGTINLGNGQTVTLTNDRYLPSSATATFTQLIGVSQIDDLIALLNQLCDQGAVAKGQCNSLGNKLQSAKKSIASQKWQTAINQLEAFIHELDAQRGKGVNQQAYDLLRSGALAVINLLPH